MNNTIVTSICFDDYCITPRKVLLIYEIYIVLLPLIIMVHAFGLYLLICVHKNGHQTIHSILTINLSIVEMLMCAIPLLSYHIPMVVLLNIDKHTAIKKHIMKFAYVYVIFSTGFILILYSAMVLITLNRLLGALFPIKYRIYATKRKVLYSILCCWVIAAAYTITSFIWQSGQMYSRKYLHGMAGLSLCFLLLCIFTYVNIFKALVRSKRAIARNSSNGQHVSSFQIFRNSRFYTSVLLVVTYCIFCVFPVIVSSIAMILGQLPEEVVHVFSSLPYFNFLSDAFIYIYLENDVRKLMFKKLHTMKFICNV